MDSPRFTDEEKRVLILKRAKASFRNVITYLNSHKNERPSSFKKDIRRLREIWIQKEHSEQDTDEIQEIHSRISFSHYKLKKKLLGVWSAYLSVSRVYIFPDNIRPATHTNDEYLKEQKGTHKWSMNFTHPTKGMLNLFGSQPITRKELYCSTLGLQLADWNPDRAVEYAKTDYDIDSTPEECRNCIYTCLEIFNRNNYTILNLDDLETDILRETSEFQPLLVQASCDAIRSAFVQFLAHCF